ncbi:LysR family transcriptional regulator [Coralloluteibacterium stylophorae]|uniref:LysR family transcriptional regulator n=1 Tax=Coralloluteibacterium stylophorae TaxID=1776034 RepID=A0A8J7VTT9_9GAMM|nr:LysR family transcriptional regulator [Coralloluteibacterium stylophorae]MBS7457613.1 LysR family transcriptional regulator [Coralloluteibacterium stylophorae]
MADLPSLTALRAFEAAARLRSLSAAARELHVTHGAISRHVRQLEDELGQALFLRRGRGLVATPAGERLGAAAGEALAGLRRTWADLRTAGDRAPLVLACPGSLLARWMIPRLARLDAELPGLRLHLAARERDPGPDLEGVDAALLIAPPPWSADWQVHPLAGERIGPVLSPRHADAPRLRAAPAAALAGLPLLATRSRPQAWPTWAHAVGMARGELREAKAFEHLLYLIEAALAGLGVAIAPEPLVAADIEAGRLIAPWGFVATGAQWILCAPRRAPDARIRPLAAWLRRELEAGPATRAE